MGEERMTSSAKPLYKHTSWRQPSDLLGPSSDVSRDCSVSPQPTCARSTQLFKRRAKRPATRSFSARYACRTSHIIKGPYHQRVRNEVSVPLGKT
jgi:hypothetical protein